MISGETFSHEKARYRIGLSDQPSGSVALVTFAQVAAHCAARRTTQTCANSGASLAAQAIADHRTTGRTDTAANRRFGAAALACGDCAARCARDASADYRTRAAAHFLADHVAQRATQATAQRSGAVAGSHCPLSNQKAKNQSRQC
jgi:hypothetical protein